MLWVDRIAAWFGYTPQGKIAQHYNSYLAEKSKRMGLEEEVLILRNAPREFERVNNGTDAVARGQRWQAFYSEEDGLSDMITHLRRGYFEKVGSLTPGDTESLKALGMADRIAREIEREVLTIIETGKLRDNERQHADRIAAITR